MGIFRTMKSLLLGTVVTLSLSVALAQDAVCGDGDTTDINVVINDGDTFKYKTSQRGKYKDNMHCLVNYELGESCAEMKLTCKKINIKNNKDCDNGDTLIITNDEEEKIVCGKKKKFEFVSSSNMLLEFISNGRKRGIGAKGCKVTCSKPNTSAPSTVAPTTAAPITAAPTTAAPITAAPTTAAPTTAAPTTAAPTTAAPVAGTGSPLENLNINPDTIAISGFSSGGAFSTQFHVAFSEKISGVGTFAGLSYLAKSGLETTSKYAEVDNLALAGLIDPVDNLKNDNVYIFQGKIDSVVPAIEAGILEDFYNNYLAEGNNIEFKEIEDSEHNFPTAETGGPCDILNGPDFVSNCAYDGAFRVLSKTLGSIEPKDEAAVDFELKDFDQAEFFGENAVGQFGNSLDKNGYVFIPDNCVNGSVQCDLHLHLHGCTQTREWIGDGYVRGTGLIPLAAKNDIVMIFPQIQANFYNPHGCWNFIGYLPEDADNYQFATKQGTQMRVVAKMVEKAAQISMF